MRKRLLSIILSLNLIFNYSLSGTAVIAEGDEGNTDSGIVDELPKEEEDENDIPPESEIEKEATPTTINLDVIPNEAFPYSIYYGQEIPDFNEKDDNSIPKYYSIAGNDGVSVPDEILGEIYQGIEVGITENFEDTPEEGSYGLKVIKAHDVQDNERNIIYHVATETLDKTFNIQKYENFPDVPLTLYVDDGKQYVRSSDEHFAISLGNSKKSFADNSETGILLSELKKHSNQYYIRNIDKDSEYRYAISDVLTYSEESIFTILKAEITNKDFDASKAVYNNSLQFNVIGEISGYSKEKAKDILKNYFFVNVRDLTKKSHRGENISFQDAKDIELEPSNDGKENSFQFSVPCEVNLSENSFMPFSVTADFKIDGVTNSQSLRFECNGKNIGNSLTLENVKPDVKELEVDGKTITVTVEDAYTGITSIEYGFEGLHWNPDPDIQKWEKSNSQEIEYIEYVNPNIDFTQHPNKLKIPIELNNVPSGNYNLCLRITDYAGNHLEWKSKEEGKNVQSDNDAPKIEVVNVIGDNESVFSNDIWYKNGNIKIKIRDGNGVPSFEIKDAEDKIFNRFNVEPEIENGNEIGKNIYIPISDLSDGEYDLKIWAKDGLENSVDIPTKIHFHVDKKNPKIEVSNKEWYGIKHQGETIKITVDEENPLSSVTVEEKENGRTFDEFKNEAGNEINIPISMFQDGEHCLTINAEDVAGNPAEEKVIVFHVDTACPTIKVFDVVDGKEFSFTNDNENWYGIQQQGDSIRIEISEQFSELTVMDETTNKSFKIENNKEYVIPISEFSENGEHRLKRSFGRKW